MAIVGQLEKIKIVPVLVLNSLDEGMAVCSDLYTHGLRAAEITFRTSAAEAVIREAGLRYPDMLLGAGTVLNVADLHRAFAAGAKFAVAPGFNSTVVKEARRCGFEFAPGVCTPSECEQAIEHGCTFLKFFPAEASGGTAMLKSLIAPYRHLGIRFMPTGGVKPENVRSYLDIPEVAAVGGTWLNKCPVEMIDSAAAIAREYAK